MVKKLRQAKWRYSVGNVFYIILTITGIFVMLVSLLFIGIHIYLSTRGVPTQAHAIKYFAAVPGPDSAKKVEFEYFVDGQRYTQTNDIPEKYFREQPQEFIVKYQKGDPGGDVLVSIRDKLEDAIPLFGLALGTLFILLPYMGRWIDRQIETKGYVDVRPACICGRSKTRK